jgi:hypothetical protein
MSFRHGNRPSLHYKYQLTPHSSSDTPVLCLPQVDFWRAANQPPRGWIDPAGPHPGLVALPALGFLGLDLFGAEAPPPVSFQALLNRPQASLSLSLYQR